MFCLFSCIRPNGLDCQISSPASPYSHSNPKWRPAGHDPQVHKAHIDSCLHWTLATCFQFPQPPQEWRKNPSRNERSALLNRDSVRCSQLCLSDLIQLTTRWRHVSSSAPLFTWISQILIFDQRCSGSRYTSCWCTVLWMGQFRSSQLEYELGSDQAGCSPQKSTSRLLHCCPHECLKILCRTVESSGGTTCRIPPNLTPRMVCSCVISEFSCLPR